ncbi:putative signal peptide protein [Collimonas fungivorans Ter331]|uniref:Putative signal peptide protein n=2 Tax=Collimonas fungivorans TaxID=158899 RepID=G0ABU6_COLFT|nr:putative signal peptide protein [Collimonas fungivorans Ter331]
MGENMKRILCAAALAALSATAFIPSQAMAQIGVNITIGTPPPAPRYERVPPPRVGYVWAPGYWNWNGSRHVWAGGHWERARSGYQYSRPEWRQGNNGWELNRGGWRRGDDRRDDRHDDRRGDDWRDDGNGRYHCPPGQAKKGNC